MWLLPQGWHLQVGFPASLALLLRFDASGLEQNASSLSSNLLHLRFMTTTWGLELRN